MGELLKVVQDNWATLIKAPVVFIVLLFVGLGAGFWGGQFWSAKQVADAESTVGEYRRVGPNASPEDLAKQFNDLRAQISVFTTPSISDSQASAMDRSWQDYKGKDQDQLVFGYTESCDDSEAYTRSLASIFVQTGWHKVTVVSKQKDDDIIDLKISGTDIANAGNSIVSALIAAQISVEPANALTNDEFYVRLPRDLGCA